MRAISILVAALGLATACRADDLATKGRAILNQYQQAIVTLQTVVETRITMTGKGSQTNDSHHNISGTIVSPSGLVAVSLSALDPSQALKAMAAKDPRVKVEADLPEIKILLGDGKEAAAEVALREPDLDLALVRPTSKPAAPLTAVDLSQAGKADVLDQVIALNRLGTAAGRVCSVSVERIAAVVDQPRRFYIPEANMSTATLGAPAFTLEGKVLGLFLIRNTGNTAPVAALDSPAEALTGIILPAAEVLKVVQRVPTSEGK